MRLTEYIQKSLFPDIVPDNEHHNYGKRPPWVFKQNKNNFTLDGNFLELIDHECSQIIEEYKKAGKVIFRGSNSIGRKVSSHIYKAVPRDDRKPKDTSLDHHEEMDHLFNMIFGWPVRSSGVFATSNIYTSKSYGYVNLFLPVNGYKYVWSPKYKDLYSDFLEDLENDLEYSNEVMWIEDKTKKKYSIDDMKDIPGFKEYESDDENSIVVTLEDKDENGNNIEILLIRDEDSIDEIRARTMLDVVKTYKNNNLHRAMTSDSEIVFKCKYYYMIHLDSYLDCGNLKIEDFGLGLGN